jgi:nitroimidazol reductase NimA-like FMN-containing flavoprotein (pyridoxamine 5'-phosphate oxidase superfamily)
MPDAPTDRARVHRLPERAAYDRDTIEAILDEALICHVAWTDGEGRARALPTIHARVGDTLYLHGSRAARAWRAVAGGAEVCVVATIVDALVLARSAFHHSMNYRSVVLYGHGREVTDAGELVTAARAITHHVLPGREAEARMPTAEEFKQTILFAIPIVEASAKVRTGPPKDDDADLELPIWAGLLPLEVSGGPPQSSPDLLHGIDVPPYIARPRRP